MDIILVVSLLGENVIMTEFIVYFNLAGYKSTEVFEGAKSITMATCMLRGVASYTSVGNSNRCFMYSRSKTKINAFQNWYESTESQNAGLLAASMVGVVPV